MYIHTDNKHVRVYICIYMYTYVCTYVYTYMYICTYVYTHMYSTYVCRCMQLGRVRVITTVESWYLENHSLLMTEPAEKPSLHSLLVLCMRTYVRTCKHTHPSDTARAASGLSSSPFLKLCVRVCVQCVDVTDTYDKMRTYVLHASHMLKVRLKATLYVHTFIWRSLTVIFVYTRSIHTHIHTHTMLRHTRRHTKPHTPATHVHTYAHTTYHSMAMSYAYRRPLTCHAIFF